MTIGILGAMQEEIDGLLPHLNDAVSFECGSRTYRSGKILGHPVVIALSRIGKVAAASTVTTLIDRFGARAIIFTGVAGAVSPALKVGDVIIADQLMQHDMDGSAVMGLRRFEIPLLGCLEFAADRRLCDLAAEAAAQFISGDQRHRSAAVYRGKVASGDQFIVDSEQGEELLQAIPGLLAVEMEGGAVAQVCHEWSIPFAVIRSISDNADHRSPVSFNDFLSSMAAPLSAGVVLEMLRRMQDNVSNREVRHES